MVLRYGSNDEFERAGLIPATLPHCLHCRFCLPCWHKPLPPHSLQRTARRPCLHTETPPHSLHCLLTRPWMQRYSPPHSLQSADRLPCRHFVFLLRTTEALGCGSCCHKSAIISSTLFSAMLGNLLKYVFVSQSDLCVSMPEPPFAVNCFQKLAPGKHWPLNCPDICDAHMRRGNYASTWRPNAFPKISLWRRQPFAMNVLT